MKLISRDQNESKPFGQSVSKTFPLGGVFINAGNNTLDDSINRFIKLVFGYPYHTPKIDEYGMYLAQASALMSSSLARQVGAAIMDRTGGVIATGTNEVPFSKGGVCSEDFGSKNREFENQTDTNTEHKKQILKNLFGLLNRKGWLGDKGNNLEDLIKTTL